MRKTPSRGSRAHHPHHLRFHRETAQVVARAAAAQFGVTSPHLEIFEGLEEVRGYLLEHARHHEEVLGDDRMLVMYTLVNADIREPLQGFLAEHPISWPCGRARPPPSPPSPR